MGADSLLGSEFGLGDAFQAGEATSLLFLFRPSPLQIVSPKPASPPFWNLLFQPSPNLQSPLRNSFLHAPSWVEFGFNLRTSTGLSAKFQSRFQVERQDFHEAGNLGPGLMNRKVQAIVKNCNQVGQQSVAQDRNSLRNLLVPQRLNWIQARRLQRWEESRHNSHQ
jgi:hypothetical protein